MATSWEGDSIRRSSMGGGSISKSGSARSGSVPAIDEALSFEPEVQWGTPQARSAEWADVDVSQVEALLAESGATHWRRALARFEQEEPFFFKRLTDLGRANWHVLLLSSRAGAALDVGCGFGTLALGLGQYFRNVMGVDVLPGRIRFASLRARQEQSVSTQFRLMNALDLRLPAGTFDLVTMNGVLEWAGLFAEGQPYVLQQQVLGQIRPLLKPKGHLAVAIENRFAMETLAGMHDTHTQLRLVPALPRMVAARIHRALRKHPLRTNLYSRAGYQRLFRAAGFPQVRVLDLVSSYNDYDFVLQPNDGLSYGLLWRNQCVRTFYPRAGSWRKQVARINPAWLGYLSYAYLVIGGEDTTTALDASHRIWTHAAQWGLNPGVSRFAVKQETPGNLTLLCHDGNRATAMLEYGATLGRAEEIMERLPENVRKLVSHASVAGETEVEGVAFRGFACH